MLAFMKATRRSLPRPRGIGLIEMMVAMVLGLFLVGVGAALLVGQISEQRRRLLEVRVAQEMRGAAALIERDLRRAGYWGAAERAAWSAGQDPLRPDNPYVSIHPASGEAAAAGYAYSRDTSENGVIDNNERFGFRINPGTRALEMRLGGAALVPASGDAWQAVTEPAILRITQLTFRTDLSTIDLSARCSLACPTGGSGCPPTLVLRSVTVDLQGSAAADPAMTRVLRATVRLRADELAGACPAG